MLPPATWWRVLAIGLGVLGCTSHTPEAEAEREVDVVDDVELPPEPAPPPILETPVASPPWRETVTPLSHKPFVGAIGDLNGDQQPDLVALCHAPPDPSVHPPRDARLLVLQGSRDGTFVEAEPVAVDATGVALGDLDGDADLDALLLEAGRPSYRVALNDGTGTFAIGSQHDIHGRSGGEHRHASLADLDRDGDLDAIVPMWDDVRVLLGDGTGKFESRVSLRSGRDQFETALADVDADGYLDLAATSGAAPTNDRDIYEAAGASTWIYRGSASGFADPVRVEISGAEGLAFADLDGDTRLELVVSGEGGLTVIRDPLGDPQSHRKLVATDGPLVIADILDTPGSELITISFIQASVHVLGEYPKLDKTSIEAGSLAADIFAADVARDGGHPDLVLLDAGPPNGQPAWAIEVLFFDP